MVNKTSKAKIAANKRYNEKTFDVLQCRIKKSERINERINNAIQDTNTTKAAFILDAIQAKLNVDPNTITIRLDPVMLYNMDGAIKYGYGTDRVQYILQAVSNQLQHDIETEKAKRKAGKE